MADYGVTDIGFVRPRLPELRREIIADLRDRLGRAGFSADIETRPDSLYGLIIDTFADREAALWEAAEGVYYAMYPSSATGAALDRAVSFAGVTRLDAEPSIANVVLYGDQGTAVPAGSQIRSGATNSLWQTIEDAIISATAAIDVRIEVTDTSAGSWTVTIGATNYTYSGSGSRQDILNGLEGTISGDPLVTVSNNGALLRISSNIDNFAVSVGAGLGFERIGTQVVAETVEKIAEVAEPGDLSNMVSLVPGWKSVNNRQAGIVGRERETDAALRARYHTGVYRLGTSTLPAIEANIFERVVGVDAVRVFENKEDTPQGGMSPHSIQVVVDGGLDLAIAQEIYANKAAGIDTNGAQVVTLQTPQGPQEIRFDRAERIYIWANIVVALLDADEGETFPSDGLERIARKVLEYGNSLTIGNDVLPQRFYCHIFEVPGVESAVITLDSSTDPNHTPSYSAGEIPIGRAEIADFSMTRITVI